MNPNRAMQRQMRPGRPPGLQQQYRSVALHAAQAKHHLGAEPPSSWSQSAGQWVDYGSNLAWRAANAPADFARTQVDATIDTLRTELDQTARTLLQLAADAHKTFRTSLSDTLKLMASTMRQMVESFWGVPPLVMALGFIALLAGGAWFLFGTSAGAGMLGSLGGAAGAVGAGAGKVATWGFRGAAAYATGGASEIARVAR
jgi:hypothetical protein